VGPARARTVRCTRREITTTAAAALRAWEGSGARAMRTVGLGRNVRWSAPVRNATARARPTTAATAARANTRGVARSPAFATPGGPRTRPARAANARPVTTDRRANSAPTLRIPHATRGISEQGRAPATTAHRRGFGSQQEQALIRARAINARRAIGARPARTAARASRPVLPRMLSSAPDTARAATGKLGPAHARVRWATGATGMYGLLQLSGRAVAVALITSAGTVCRQE